MMKPPRRSLLILPPLLHHASNLQSRLLRCYLLQHFGFRGLRRAQLLLRLRGLRLRLGKLTVNLLQLLARLLVGLRCAITGDYI